MPQLYTIGFTQKSAQELFTKLRESSVRTVIDIRLNNTSQLAGYTKKEDFKFFLKEVADIDYVHIPELAPTPELFDRYKKQKGDWNVFKEEFLNLLVQRQVEKIIPKSSLADACLLCSEVKPHECHRSLVVAYLKQQWSDINHQDL